MPEPQPGIEIALRLPRAGFRLEVELTLPSAGTTAVFGPSGSGKSSLLRALAGLEPAAEGRLRVNGATWQDGHQRLPAHRRAVGVVFQHPGLLPHLSVAQNLRYGWRRAGAPARLLDDWIERLALGPLLGRRAATLSGGEGQRVALARALASAPAWLLLDEPLSALDAARRAEILPCLEAVRREAGIPILYITHAIEEVARLADHLVLLEQGRVQAVGPALELLGRSDLPPALREDAGVVLEGRVATRDADGLLALETPAGLLRVQGGAHPVGTRLRLRILARDVSLALSRHEDTSILNLLPARIEALDRLGDGQVQLRLRVGEAALLARVSAHSAARLALRPELAAWAQVKAVAVLL